MGRNLMRWRCLDGLENSEKKQTHTTVGNQLKEIASRKAQKKPFSAQGISTLSLNKKIQKKKTN